MLRDISVAVSTLVTWIINLAPFGILGLVFHTISTSRLNIFTEYGNLLVLERKDGKLIFNKYV
ncbi:hypothetical protein GCM10008922_27690 [Faecalicatena contorta]